MHNVPRQPLAIAPRLLPRSATRVDRLRLPPAHASLPCITQFFNMDCRACGQSQAEVLGLDSSLLGGL